MGLVLVGGIGFVPRLVGDVVFTRVLGQVVFSRVLGIVVALRFPTELGVGVEEGRFVGGRGARLVGERRLEGLVELVGEALLAEELVEFVLGVLAVGARDLN